MAGTYTILPAHSLVVTRGWGTLTDRDLLAHARAVAADPRFAPSFFQLVDLRDVVQMNATSKGVWQLVEANPFGAGARRAVVVRQDVVYGMARMYQMMRGDSPDHLEVFRDFDQAIEWLGVVAVRPLIVEALQRGDSPMNPA